MYVKTCGAGHELVAMVPERLHARADAAMRLAFELDAKRESIVGDLSQPIERERKLTHRINRLFDYAHRTLAKAREALYGPAPAPRKVYACERCRDTGRMAYIDAGGDADIDVCDCVINRMSDDGAFGIISGRDA